jgi:hypothetical protein
MGRTTSHAENPKDPAVSRESISNASSSGHALADAAQSTGSKKGDKW